MNSSFEVNVEILKVELICFKKALNKVNQFDADIEDPSGYMMDKH